MPTTHSLEGIENKVAFLSVYHKEGIVDFAQELRELGWRLIASGGTARALRDAGLEVEDVADFTGAEPILGHRVVTLHPNVYAPVLAKPTEEHVAELLHLGLPWIDLVCVDLYPLEEAIAKPDATEESVIEQTDIGGPTLLRAAAKGRRLVIADPEDRFRVLQWLKDGVADSPVLRRTLAAKAERIVGNYALASANYLDSLSPNR